MAIRRATGYRPTLASLQHLDALKKTAISGPSWGSLPDGLRTSLKIGFEAFTFASRKNSSTGSELDPASLSTVLKGLQKDLKMDSDEQPLSGHSFRVGAALDLLEQGEPLERIML